MSTTFTVPKYAAEAKRFSGEITGGSYVWKACLDWKPAPAKDAGLNPSKTVGRETGPRVITAGSEAFLHAELRRLDPSVKFVKASTSKTKLGTTIATTDSDANLLEQMRVDPAVSNTSYCNACRQFGQQARPRPDFTAAPVTVDKSPYSEKETGEINYAFLQYFLRTHPELTAAGHGPHNTSVLMSWHQDSGFKVLNASSLAQAHAECSELGFFRTQLSGVRSRGVSPNIVHSYSFQKIQDYRREKDEIANPQPASRPAQGSPEDFADRARILRLATNHVKQTTSLNPASGEFARKRDALIREWAIESSPNLARKAGHF